MSTQAPHLNGVPDVQPPKDGVMWPDVTASPVRCMSFTGVLADFRAGREESAAAALPLFVAESGCCHRHGEWRHRGGEKEEGCCGLLMMQSDIRLTYM